LNILTIHPERLMESAVCSDNAQVLIENQERIADRIYDRLRERVRLIEVYERLTVRPRQRGSWQGARSIVRRFHVYPPKSSPLQRAPKTSSCAFSCISKLTNSRPLRSHEAHHQRRARPETTICFFNEKANHPRPQVKPHAQGEDCAKLLTLKRPVDCAAQQRYPRVTKYEDLIFDLRLVVQNDIQQ
jgi:hypothetical protein